jgi:hypothetical protein
VRFAHVLAFSAILVLSTLFLLLHQTPPGALALGASPSGDTSATASQETTAAAAAAPAPDKVVRAALARYHTVQRLRLQCARASRCVGTPLRLRVARPPSRRETESTWRSASAAWCRQTRELRDRLSRLLDRMRDPGGSSGGRRWLPLARWVGWPDGALPTLAAIITRESSGRERAYNGSSGCSGLLQLWPGHVAASQRPQLLTAEFNLRVGLRLYRESGWSPWAL